MTDKLDIGALHNFYHGLSDLVGPEAMMKIYEQYKGTQLSVPVHLYDRDLAAQRVVREFNGHNQQDLARIYGYSEKWVKSVLRQSRQDEQLAAKQHRD
ncbi:Mor transcription activator family protein [Levilactobacillus brevis]|uniref:Mor transcription activator family protein n=1 Tax=Levilactobacillus brevis TaxID=1580 RepID=UPI0020CBCB69|nr:Mor transcription activator family protein [Levilactobacillus brevis]MCP9613242.1 hypothetical protein [Levilactobacillus brevis]